MSKVILRDFNPETDTALIHASYPKGVWYGVAEPFTMSKAKWFKHFFSFMQKQLQHAEVYIACFEDEPNEILGFSIIDQGQLEFVFVKPCVRKQGIATLLTKRKYSKINKQNLTKPAIGILNNHPELLGESDDRNGRSKEETRTPEDAQR